MLDCVREIRPPFSPDTVVEEFAALLKSYGVSPGDFGFLWWGMAEGEIGFAWHRP